MGNNILNLEVGDQIRIGKEYAKKIGGLKSGETITLIKGYFEHDNGLYTDTIECPSIWNEDEEDFDSIFHLFGNNLEKFMDCEILNK